MAHHDGHERAEDRLGKKYLIVNLREKWQQVKIVVLSVETQIGMV